MELTFYSTAVALVAQLLGLNLQAILGELKQHGALDATARLVKSGQATLGGLLPVCKKEGAMGIVPWGVTFKTPYGTVEINGGDILHVQGEAWRMQELLRDVATALPEAEVAAAHYNFPAELDSKRPARQLVRELEALQNNASNETLEIVAYTVLPPEEVCEPDWTAQVRFEHVRSK